MSFQVEAWAPPIVTYVVDFTNVATAGADISNGATGIEEIILKTSQDCYIVFGSNASMSAADSGDMLLQPQDGWVRLRLRRDSHFISVVRAGASNGTLHYYIPGEAYQLPLVLSPEVALQRTLMEYWTTQDTSTLAVVGGTAVQSWTGVLRGTVLSAAGASNRAVYHAADADFAGEPSLEFNTSSLVIGNAAVSGVLAAGQAANIVMMVKLTTLPGANSSLMQLAAGAQNVFALTNLTVPVAHTIMQDSGGSTAVDPSKTVTTGVHMLAFTYTAGGAGITYVDGSPGASDSGGDATLAAAVDTINLGNIAGKTAPNFKIVAAYLCYDAPTQAELNLALAYARDIWGAF